jgi:rhamnulokinase
MSRFVAVDLGASSGRVMLAELANGDIALRQVHRFANRPVIVRGTLYWDVLALWSGVLDGLRIAGRSGPIDGIGVDSWAVDYALLDADGQLLGNPVHYRDQRTTGVAERVAESIAPEKLYGRTGVQMLPINTIFQLVAARSSAAMAAAAHALLIPDLFNYWLCGYLGTELTNASTTGLLDPRTRTWCADLFATLDLRADLFAPMVEPGASLGELSSAVAVDAGIKDVPVFAVGSHDTASAVLGVPVEHDRFAYISCGTWSLVGVEIDAPIVSEAARAANFSNELGVDGTIRFLRNVMGLWLLQESIRSWERDADPVDLGHLLTEAERVPAGRFVIDPDRPEFLPPGDMPARIRAECRRTGQREPQSPPEITRCILDSLADAYRRAIREAAELAGVDVDVVHLVGGGANNALLCRLTAQACELPVVAGPVEAAAYGNVLVQARAAGAAAGDRYRLRKLLRSIDTTTYGTGR